MKKRSKAYWEKRAADRMVDYMADAERTSNTLGKAYYSVGRYLSDEAAKILKSFTDTFGLSESEARQLIGTTPEKSITEKLKKALPKIADKDKRRQAEAMISSPAYSYRIKRLENLGNNVRKQCSQLYNTEVLADDSFFRGLCDDAYKHCIFDMQKGMGVSSAFDIMPTSRINRILGAKWSGEHFSARVWGNTNALADGLQNDLLVGIMSGKSEKKMAEDIMNRCAVGAFEARRLVRTEACYIANQAELDGYRQTGIESYEFSAVLDNRTSKLCDNVDGLDGKIFKISEAVPGKNLPPMHPFCRSTTLPILPSEEELDREIAGLSDEIGTDVDFEEWKKGLQPVGDKQLRYFKYADKGGSEDTYTNKAKAFEMFSDNDLKAGDPTIEEIVEELSNSSIGRETLEMLSILPESIVLTHGVEPELRGTEDYGHICIYVNNCRNIQWVARTVIHEFTHYRYGIGESQWSECVCIAQELKHARNRDYLTIAEKRAIIKAVKSDGDYKKWNWRKGGRINGRTKKH